MNPLRFLFVTDRFWPIVDPAALAIESVSHALARRGHSVRVLTRRWQKYWAPELRVGEVDVMRLPYSARTRFGAMRLVKHMNQWLEAHRIGFDLIVIDPFDKLFSATIPWAVRNRFPICFWPTYAEAANWDGSALQIRPSQTSVQYHSAWIGPMLESACDAARWTADARRITNIGPFVDCAAKPNVTRSIARVSLAENHPLFAVGPNEPLIVSIGNWNDARGILPWIDCWEMFSRDYPGARFWIVGDGEELPRIAEHIRTRQVAHQVLLVGRFDDWSGLLRAADVLIQSGTSAVPLFPTLCAMSAELPVVVSGTELPHNAWLKPGVNGFWCETGDSRRMAQMLLQTLQQTDLRATVARNAQLHVRREHNLDAGVAELERLGQELVAKLEKVRS